MNKILVYTVIAILLGTVTMGAPLVVLEPWDTISNGKNILDVPNSEQSQQERGSENGGTFEANDMLDGPETPEPELGPVPSAPVEPSESKPQEPEAWSITLSGDDSSSSLSSIGFMIVPSFLIALGAFVYLKKRIV